MAHLAQLLIMVDQARSALLLFTLHNAQALLVKGVK